MKNIYIKRKSFYAKVIFLLLALALMAGRCIYVTQDISILQVQEDGTTAPVAKAGSVATFIINGYVWGNGTSSENDQLVVSFLAPKSWKVRENTKVTYTTSFYSNPKEELPMSVIPELSLPKNGNGLTWSQKLMMNYGVGPNVLEDMEWVSFVTDKIWSVYDGDKPDYTVYIRTNVGQQNLKAYLGFFVNHTNDGISNSEDDKVVQFSKTPFEVIDGIGLTIDYSTEHFNKVQPLYVLQDDYVTFSFNGGVYPNTLVGLGDIYLQAIAYDSKGAIISQINEKSDKTLLTKESPYSQTYNLTIWPADFFHVPEGTVIDHIEYVFTDKSGTVTITQSDDDKAVNGTGITGEKKPFQFQLLCM